MMWAAPCLEILTSITTWPIKPCFSKLFNSAKILSTIWYGTTQIQIDHYAPPWRYISPFVFVFVFVFPLLFFCSYEFHLLLFLFFFSIYLYFQNFEHQYILRYSIWVGKLTILFVTDTLHAGGRSANWGLCSNLSFSPTTNCSWYSTAISYIEVISSFKRFLRYNTWTFLLRYPPSLISCVSSQHGILILG